MDNNYSLLEFKDLLFTKNVPVKDLKDHLGEPLTKILAYWRRHELLPFIQDGKKIQISFAQLIWLRILDDLRKINFPLSKMILLCDYFFKDAYFNDLPKLNMEKNREAILKRMKIGSATEEDGKMLEILEIGLGDPKIQHIYKFDINYLSNYIAACISNKEDGNIYILFDGNVAEYIGQQYWGHKADKIDLSNSHIRLTVSNYLKEFINDEELSKLLMPQLLNEDEITVLREMRRKNVREINIYKSNEEKPWKIETTNDGVFTEKEAKIIKETLGLKNYEAIELKTIDEKSIYFRVTRKKIRF